MRLPRGEGCGKHESCDEGSANYRRHPKRNPRGSARGDFDVPDRTGPLAEFDRKFTSFFQQPRQADRGFLAEQGDRGLE